MKYKTVDNFLKLDHLNYLQTLIETLEPKSDYPTSFRTRKSYSDSENTISREKLMELEETYIPRAMDILKFLAPHKLALVDNFAFNLQSTPPNFSYPVHLDANEKVLSGVVYLKPNRSTGTFLHKSLNDVSGEEIPWAVNRAMFFSRNPSDSWHSYRGDGVGFRWVLVFNLLTSKVRKHEIKDLGFIKYYQGRISKQKGLGVEKYKE